MNHTQQTKIGPAHGTPHRKVWIEGKHLAAAGFKPGDRYHRTEAQNGIIITWSREGKFKVSGKGEKPILDISGAIIPRLFPQPATHVTVEFISKLVTITTP